MSSITVNYTFTNNAVTAEGEMYNDVNPITISPDSSGEPCIFLIWPITVVHVIDENSPFYRHSAPELASDKFEIHVVLEGTIEATSMTFQARTSYLPKEVLWGHRFEQMMIFRQDHNKYQVNFSAFNSTYEADTPLCSSKELEALYESRRRFRRQQRQRRRRLQQLQKLQQQQQQQPRPQPQQPVQPLPVPEIFVEDEDNGDEDEAAEAAAAEDGDENPPSKSSSSSSSNSGSKSSSSSTSSPTSLVTSDVP